MLKTKKLISRGVRLAAVFVLVSLLLAGVALADPTSVTVTPDAGQLTGEVNRIASGIVGFVRGIFATAAVVFVIWAGIVAWGAGSDANKWLQVKKLAAGFILCMVCVFAAEKIVGGFMGILGYKP
ncbi:TrbC/VIRB2 family protein [Thermodesulfitimonas autotrophica]|uniref:TrbC/VIRB2 family protein n=1 Tax=Thermodesulfitimonas autotrophica TaxID=1894989 RepID=A0A3N5AX86_9THEO|nr:TrbC/VirB2 family protein [Thermodesulfitimonas autotrophica]RPF49614.1 TrbC/VIRB2 family protein [Thermodesulfitimonas autotrophica]